MYGDHVESFQVSIHFSIHRRAQSLYPYGFPRIFIYSSIYSLRGCVGDPPNVRKGAGAPLVVASTFKQRFGGRVEWLLRRLVGYFTPLFDRSKRYPQRFEL